MKEHVAHYIRQLIDKYRQENQLTFEEETHKYSILNKTTGQVITDLPSVSKVYKRYKKQFDADTISLRVCKGDRVLAEALMAEWAANGTLQAHKGSYVHYHLEKHLNDIYAHKSDVRQPIFENVDMYQLEADAMIEQGKQWIRTMIDRGAYLVGTEIEMGSLRIGMFGQLDKLWVMQGKDGNTGLVITDWKTNKPDKFEVTRFSDLMYKPFDYLLDTAHGEYSVQLGLYARLISEMTNYEFPILGAIIVNVTPDSYVEYRVDRKVFNQCSQLVI